MILEKHKLSPKKEELPLHFEFAQEQAEKVDAYEFFYLSYGKKIKGFVVYPKTSNNQQEKFPVIIFNRGGSKDFGKIDSKHIFGSMSRIARAGYVVLASQYPGVDGGEGKDELGGEDLDHVLSLKEVASEIECADTCTIGMYGVSRGGAMTYMSLRKVEWIQAAVVAAGTTDYESQYLKRPGLRDFRKDMYNTYSEQENKKRSALYWVEEVCPHTPILLLHGEKDDKADCVGTIQLAIKLKELNRPFGMHIYYDDDHYFSKTKERYHVDIIKWFDIHLKKYI